MGSAQSGWSRFDTLGSTLYVAETEEIAFAELLAPYARILGGKDPLAKDAAALGLSLREFIAEVAADWDEASFMQMGHVMAAWRNRRLLYTLTLDDCGYWVDIEHRRQHRRDPRRAGRR